MTLTEGGAALKEAEKKVKKNRAQRKLLDRLFKNHVEDSEMTAAQLAQIQPNLKAATMARHPEWFA